MLKIFRTKKSQILFLGGNFIGVTLGVIGYMASISLEVQEIFQNESKPKNSSLVELKDELTDIIKSSNTEYLGASPYDYLPNIDVGKGLETIENEAKNDSVKAKELILACLDLIKNPPTKEEVIVNNQILKDTIFKNESIITSFIDTIELNYVINYYRELDKIKEGLDTASITFNIPESMNVNENQIIGLIIDPRKDRVRKKSEIIELIMKDLNVDTTRTKIQTENIKIASVMSAELTGIGFDIRQSEIQKEPRQIMPPEITQWEWDVKALEQGKLRLTITLWAVMNGFKEGFTKHIKVKSFRKYIYVQVGIIDTITLYLVKYKEPLTYLFGSGTVIGLIQYIVSKFTKPKRKKRKPKNKIDKPKEGGGG